jgi:UDP-hydrolysing UDP-N-acetyl-D-glucosamine 2-epimerase
MKQEVFKITKKESFKKEFLEDFILFLYHPVTTEYGLIESHIEEVLASLSHINLPIIALWPNIDAGSKEIVTALKRFEIKLGGRIGIFNNFNNEVFVSLLKYAKVVVGNSSSGVREACYFGTPVVNIGSRQSGRVVSKNVISVEENKESIIKAINSQIKKGRYPVEKPFGEGDSGKKIAQKLTELDLEYIQKKLSFK